MEDVFSGFESQQFYSWYPLHRPQSLFRRCAEGNIPSTWRASDIGLVCPVQVKLHFLYARTTVWYPHATERPSLYLLIHFLHSFFFFSSLFLSRVTRWVTALNSQPSGSHLVLTDQREGTVYRPLGWRPWGMYGRTRRGVELFIYPSSVALR